MLQVDVNVSELRDFAKRLPELKEGIFPLMNLNLKATATQFLNDLLAAEFSLFIGREKYERNLVEFSSRVLRNGHYQRSFAVKGLGRLLVKVPRDRSGKFKTKALEPYRRMEASLEEDLAVLYLMGLSTRGLALISILAE